MVAIATISPSRVINTTTKVFFRVNMHNCTYVASP
jgi:DNA-binding CsgD family transcriptional regulator